MNRCGLGVALAIVLAIVPGACGRQTFHGAPPPLAFDVVEPRMEGAILECSPQTLWETPEGTLALACADATQAGHETIIVVSSDDGATWTRAGTAPSAGSDPSVVDGHIHVVSDRDGRLRHSVSTDLGRSWSRESMIVDYPVTLTNRGDVAIAAGSGLVLAVWSEKRDGSSAVYVSRSEDRGLTWQPPRLVERGASGRSMTRVNAAVSGTHVAVAWADDRDSATLFDIRCALSTDGGRSWRPSVRVNDDAEAVWQDRPAVAVQADRVLVLFDDFREPWIEGDRDYNIYAGYSTRGELRFTNTRVNDLTPGMQLGPRLAVSPDGRRIAAVWWDAVQSLFGELSAAQSLDWGESWSPTTHVWQWEPGTESRGGRLAFRQNGRLAVAIHAERFGRVELAMATECPAVAGEEPRHEGPPSALPRLDLPLIPGPAQVSDDFSDASASPWMPVHGTWIVNEGSLVGFGERETLCIRAEPGATDGEISGRFRLDPIEHRSARLFVRGAPGADGWRGYLVENFFRMGVRLWRQEGSRRIPMASAVFPFQRDRWYRFRLVLSGTRLDYAIDDRLLLQSDALTEVGDGRVGLGGEYFPVYFDDVTIRSSAPSRRR